jgi:1,4-dihydroxy-6-naphthoate synthase
MHYGLASGKVPTDGIEFDHLLADIETLNRAAFEGKYEVSAVSFHAYALLTDKYLLLPHGSSMGDDYGPIVVARADGPSSTKGIKIAIPGTLTTAFLALRLYDPQVAYVVMPFDQIQEAVRDGEVAAGLLIHEGQLTYQDDGLKKIVDLGEWWAERTGGLPLPLGAMSSGAILEQRRLPRCRGSCTRASRMRSSIGRKPLITRFNLAGGSTVARRIVSSACT